MPQTRWNKGKTIVNSDAYNLSGDMATLDDTLNVVVPVASQSERDALVPPQGVYGGMVVSRTDLPGAPIQTRDGSGVWATQQVPKVWANNPHVGSASNLLTNLQSGTIVPIIQGGTIVCTTDANGYSNFLFPQAFPNGLLFWVGMNADDVATGTGVFITQGSANATLTQAFFHARNATTNANYASQSIRLDYMAIGW